MWLPSPPPGTSICLGFDGSESDDWTVLKAETQAGHIFTPRYGPNRRPTIWKPRELNAGKGGHIPRSEVHAAVAEVCATFDVRRAYCDPGFHDETSWETEIEEWDVRHPDTEFVAFPTTSGSRMFPAIRRVEADLSWITHDGCPDTNTGMRNARKVMARSGRVYGLGKPAHTQKIDTAVTVVICHEAASDERAAGWPDREETLPPIVFGF